MFCKYCGKQLPDTAVFCSQCGKQIATAQNTDNHEKGITGSAGTDVQQSTSTITYTQFQSSTDKAQYNPSESPKSRLAAALLAFFLGEFGAHRFYVGKVQSAIVQIIMSLSFWISLFLFAEDFIEAAVFFLLIGIAWIIWLIADFIMILCGNFKDKDNLPLMDWGL